MVNMWCAHTLMLTNPMQRVAPTMTGYPKIGSGKYRNDLGCKRESGNNENVDFRMAKNPEEVHPKGCGASRLGVKEMSAEITIHGKHDLSRGERRDCKKNHPDMIRYSHASKGIRSRVIPGHRMQEWWQQC